MSASLQSSVVFVWAVIFMMWSKNDLLSGIFLYPEAHTASQLAENTDTDTEI